MKYKSREAKSGGPCLRSAWVMETMPQNITTTTNNNNKTPKLKNLVCNNILLPVLYQYTHTKKNIQWLR